MEAYDKISISDLQEDGLSIEHVDNPSIEFQLTAIEQNPWAIAHMENPNIQTLLKAIDKNGFTVIFAKKQSQKLQIRAVKQNPCVIYILNNPTKKVLQYSDAHNENGHLMDVNKIPKYTLLKIIQRCPRITNNMINMNKKLMDELIEEDPFVIDDFVHVSDEIKLLALEKDPHALAAIEEPTFDMVMQCVKRDPSTIAYIDIDSIDGDFKNKLFNIIIENDPCNIKFIENPSQEIQFELLNLDPCNIVYIQNPSLETMCMAVSKKPQLLNKIHTADINNVLEMWNIIVLQYTDKKTMSLVHDSIISRAMWNDDSYIMSRIRIKLLKYYPNELKHTIQPNAEEETVAVDTDPSLLAYVLGNHMKTFVPFYMWINNVTVHKNKSSIPSRTYIKYNDHVDKLIRSVFKKDPHAIQYLKLQNITQSDITSAIERDSMTLQHIPKKYMKSDICEMAIRQNWRTVQFVPHGLFPYLYELAIDMDIRAFQYIKHHVLPLWLQMKAVSKDHGLFSQIINPHTHVIRYAVRRDWRNIEFVKNPSHSIVHIALKQNKAAIIYIKHNQLMDSDIYQAVVEHSKNFSIVI